MYLIFITQIAFNLKDNEFYIIDIIKLNEVRLRNFLNTTRKNLHNFI